MDINKVTAVYFVGAGEIYRLCRGHWNECLDPLFPR